MGGGSLKTWVHSNHFDCLADRVSCTTGVSCTQERAQYLHQFVLHASLDAVEEQLWTTPAMHLGTVDRFNNLQVASPAISLLPCLQSSVIQKGFRLSGLVFA